MQLYVLNPQYEKIGLIDEAESVLWNKKYNDEGYCEIYISCSAELLSMLEKGNYIYRYDDDMFCQITTVEIETDVENGDYIIATAKDMCSVLSGRIVRWLIAYSGSFGGFVKKVLTDNVVTPKLSDGSLHTVRQIDNFVIDFNEKDFPEKIEVSSFTDDLLALIVAHCKTYDVGFRVSLDITAGKLKFKLYRGKNKASTSTGDYVEFSPTFANIISSAYKTDSADYKNVAYVGYKDDTDRTQLLSVYKGQNSGQEEPQGEKRKEIYVDGTGTSRDITLEGLQQIFGTLGNSLTRQSYEKTDGTNTVKGYNYFYSGETVAISELSTKSENGVDVTEEKITITDYTYLLLIRVIGENALAERTNTQSFSGEVDTSLSYIYKVDFDLGDTVKVINDYGIEAEAQITEVLETEDNEDGHTVEPTFEFKN